MEHEVSSPRWTEPGPHLIAEWIDERDRMDRVLAPFGKRMLERAALVPGENIVDVGCGTGATILEAWSRVAPTGSVTGIDVSEAMLAAARQRVDPLKNANVAFVQADAQAYVFEPAAFDVAVSRFGVAHFADTAAAFANIGSALRSGGRFVFCEWSARADNEWMSLADDVAQRVVPERSPPR